VKIADTRKTTPGLRMLEKYAVLLGGGTNHRYGLDDGLCIKSNHAGIAGGLGAAVKRARAAIGHVHMISVEVANQAEATEAIEAGANVLVVGGLDPSALMELVGAVRKLSTQVTIEVSGEVSGPITLENVRAYADAGPNLIRVDALTQSVKAMAIGFQIQAG
jgi:nicotinate-nucleotide pyrophosphorylase (carboxylating)